MPLRNKLTGVAHAAIDKLSMALDLSTDPEFALAVADKALHRLGYAPSKQPSGNINAAAGSQINVFTTASPEALAKARERRRAFYEGQVVDESPALPAPEELSPGG
jgi:hypothetical protein